jgi:hypothetical protein
MLIVDALVPPDPLKVAPLESETLPAIVNVLLLALALTPNSPCCTERSPLIVKFAAALLVAFTLYLKPP